MLPVRPNTMVPSTCAPNVAIGYTIPQSGFTMPSMAPQFRPSTIVYPPPNVSGVPPTGVPIVGGQPYQRVYVPVQQMPVHPYTSIPVGQLPVSDPSKSLQDQRKLEKERNFQWQQQRLKQFTVAGKKGSLNANTILNSMFGKHDSKKESAKPIPSNDKNKNSNQPLSFETLESTNMLPPLQVQVIEEKQKVPTSAKNTKENPEIDPKKLENMMLKCSTLSGPQKAKGFQKPLVKEISKAPQVSQNTVTFSSSEKAINWNNIHGLENVFKHPKYPVWCTKESVPSLYKLVENIVTEDGKHPPSTSLLFPILLSSGLSQKILSDIWELVNITTPGELSSEEMYAVLALIAVVQAGHKVTDINILHRLPSCPIPLLQYFQMPSPASELPSPTSPTDHHIPSATESSNSSVSNSVTSKPLESSSIITPRPTYIPLHGNAVNSTPNPPWNAFAALDGETPLADDEEFDDFKSATPVAINAPPMTISGTPSQFPNETFADFKQAEFTVTSLPQIKFEKCKLPTTSIIQNTEPDLMCQDDDKYSVFRELQINEQNTNQSALMSETDTSVFSTVICNEDPIEKIEHLDKIENSQNSFVTNKDDEEFGDFLDARAETGVTASIASLDVNQESVMSNFADFSKLNEQPINQIPNNNPLSFDQQSHVRAIELRSPVEDSEFGAFGDFQTAKVDIGQEYYFPCIKDNISLTETQSISSLELPSFEGTFQNGDLKSSLSRQSSIPSLDLRCGSSEIGSGDIDDGFGEFQSTVTCHSHSPTSSIGTYKSCEDKSPSSSVKSLQFHSTSTLPLRDKYSVIRSVQVKVEDQYLSSWTRCIEGCLTILQKATRIFNQMSCSSVCNEVLNTEEGRNYIKNVIEVYRIVCRVNLAMKAYEKCNNKLQYLIEDADKAFNTLASFLTGHALMPEDASLDFTLGVLKLSLDNNEKACGVCLLNVDSRSKAFDKKEDINKLTYGGRQYHSSCANLWVNYVDPLLPALLLPQLI